MKHLALIFAAGLITLVVIFTLRDFDPDMRAARAAREWARADQEQAKALQKEAWAESWSALSDERAAALSYGMVGAVIIVLGSLGAGVIVAVIEKSRQSQLIRPDKAGQFPIIKVSGVDPYGNRYTGFFDPNRAASYVTSIGGEPVIAIPLNASEGAHVALGQQASAVAAIRAASQGEGGLGRARLDMSDLLQTPELPPPLPDVIDVDPSHIDRLLSLTGESE